MPVDPEAETPLPAQEETAGDPGEESAGNPRDDAADDPGEEHARSGQPPVIAIRDLTVRLGGDTILSGVDLSVGAGETVALLGGNGSGKTTLLRALLRLVPRQQGAIELFGQPQSRFARWSKIGYVPQKPSISLHATTLAEIVKTGTFAHGHVATGGLATLLHRRHDAALVQDSLARVGLQDRAKELFVHLSGGQQQRALIARALAQEPEVLVLDEPLASVDLDHQDSIRRALQDFRRQGKAILIVLHETDALAPLIDRAVVLRRGHVVHDGPLPRTAPHDGHEHEPPGRAPGVLTGLNPTWESGGPWTS
jgi:zinc transport system ATP-binding protein